MKQKESWQKAASKGKEKKKKGKEGLQAHKASKASKPNRPASPAHLCPLTNCMPYFCTALHMIMALCSPKKRGVRQQTEVAAAAPGQQAETPFFQVVLHFFSLVFFL